MNTLLRYDLTTDPFPLQASPVTGDLDTATLTVVASNPNLDPDRHPVTLPYFSIEVPVGSDGTDLATDDTIDAEPPAGWKSPDKVLSPGKARFVFHPLDGVGQVKSAGLNFVLKNITVGRETGTAEIVVTEGSAGDPTKQFYVTKFPNGWGQVSFSLDATEVPYEGTTTLHWSGPASANYSIQYAVDNQVINVPAEGEAKLSSQGQYPGQTDPPLILDRTTVFTLTVEDTIGSQKYDAEQQLTATVLMPTPQFTAFNVSPAGLSGAETSATLTWQTTAVSQVEIEGVGSFTGAEAVQGSAQVTCNGKQLFLAQGFGVVGYDGPPAAAHICFGRAVTSPAIPLNAPPSTNTTTTKWELVIDGNRAIFDINVDEQSVPPDDWIIIRLWLALKPGVEVADLGFAGGSASDDDLKNASYSPSLSNTDIFNYQSFFQPTDPHPHDSSDEQTSYPLSGGTTWAVQFADGSKVVLWFQGIYGLDNYQNPTLTFIWFEF